MIAFDFIVAAGMLLLAWHLLSCRDLFQSVVLFISFGLLMALAWVRLNAPDIALAEAAIGSAMTGALLLAALDEFKPSAKRRNGPGPGIASLLFCGALGFVLAFALLKLPPEAAGLRDAAATEVSKTGVSNPVTAVLLSFRGYDTLLEIGVLLMAALAVLSLGNRPPRFVLAPSRSLVLSAMVRFLLPILVLAAGYLLWVGADAPGGAFQAGSVLAGAFILAALVDTGWMSRVSDRQWRWILAAGLGVFLAAGAGTMLSGVSLLEYRGATSKRVILAIETAAALSIGATLLILFLGGTGRMDTDGKDDS